jgi:hypothetical protein
MQSNGYLHLNYRPRIDSRRIVLLVEPKKIFYLVISYLAVEVSGTSSIAPLQCAPVEFCRAPFRNRDRDSPRASSAYDPCKFFVICSFSVRINGFAPFGSTPVLRGLIIYLVRRDTVLNGVGCAAVRPFERNILNRGQVRTTEGVS